MAKEKAISTQNSTPDEKASTAYFASLALTDVKCFKGENEINLSDDKENYAKWTVILGNNNTGKTTILKCLALLEAIREEEDTEIKFSISEHNLQQYFSYNSIKIVKSTLKVGNHFLPWHFRIAGLAGEKPLFGKSATIEELPLQIISYGISRKMESYPISDYSNNEIEKHANLFENTALPNIEDWLLNLFLSEKLGKTNATKQLNIAKEILISGLLPDVYNIEIKSEEKNNSFRNFVVFQTDFGWIRLRDLGFGYQSMVAWVLDLVRRMVERYPDATNPLAEPAIVLIDEIDLHLHPDWQRKIIAHLSKYFPKTQFIVTAHSPLIVQSAEEVNLVVLKKDPISHNVTIEQPTIRNFQGWTVEEILSNLMDLEGQTMSQTYLDLMQQFEEGLDEDNYEKAKSAYDALDKILHIGSVQRKLLRLQMTSLSPELAL